MQYPYLVLLLLFLYIIDCTAKAEIAEDSIIYLKKAGKSKMIQLTRGDIQYFCVKGSKELTPSSWFYHTSFLVTSNEMMGNFMVKGISTDDFHAHLQWFMNTLLTRSKRKATLQETKSKGDLPQLKDISGGGIRDVLSASPSPWNSNRTAVQMSLSTYGTACLSVKAEWYNQQFTVTHRVEFKSQLIVNFIIGAIIIIISKEVAKSKYFHYISGSAIFIALGGLLATLYLVSIFNRKGTNRFFITLMTVSGYGISVAWLIFNRIRDLLMEYIEIVLMYCGIMAAIGVFFTSKLRSGENKSSFRLAVKFLIRFIALVVLYNSTASPMASLLTVVSSLVLFLFLPESYR